MLVKYQVWDILCHQDDWCCAYSISVWLPVDGLEMFVRFTSDRFAPFVVLRSRWPFQNLVLTTVRICLHKPAKDITRFLARARKIFRDVSRIASLGPPVNSQQYCGSFIFCHGKHAAIQLPRRGLPTKSQVEGNSHKKKQLVPDASLRGHDSKAPGWAQRIPSTPTKNACGRERGCTRGVP